MLSSAASISLSPKAAASRHIDILRGIAALAVVYAHGDHSDLIVTPWTSAHKEFLGSFGVKLFFMLSGYLIWASADRLITRGPSRWKGVAIYLVHRITRIAPLYYACVAFCVFGLVAVGSTFVPQINTETVLRHLTFSQDLAPTVSRALNPVLWTLTHEALFYLLVPLLFVIAGRHALHFLIAGGVAGLAGLGLWVPVMGPFVDVLWLFSIGALACAASDRGRMMAGPAWLGLLLAVIYATRRDIDWQAMSALAAIVAFLTLGVPSVTSLIGCLGWLAWPLQRAGTISYSIYIWHYLILNILAWHSDRIAGALGAAWQSYTIRALVSVSLIILVSTLSYVLIERPGMVGLRNATLRLVRLEERTGAAKP